MSATGLNHVSVIARDLEESVAFYRELFGMELLPSPNFGFPVVWLGVGNAQLHLMQREQEVPERQHFALTVDDFEGVFRRAKEMGVFASRSSGYLVELPNNMAQLYLKDPSGNLIEVDTQGADTLPADIRAEAVRLAEREPQSAENLRATLFPPFPAATSS